MSELPETEAVIDTSQYVYDGLTEGTSIDARTVSSFDFVVDSLTVAVESIDTTSVPVLDENVVDVPVHVLTTLDEITRKHCSYGSSSSDRGVATLGYSSSSRGIYFNELEEYQPLSREALVTQYSGGNAGNVRSSFSGPAVGASSALAKHYHPGYNPWVSPHHKKKLDSQTLLSDRPVTDSHLLLKVLDCGPKCFFEPLFGAASLFKVSPDGSIAKISETFPFDCTPDDVRGEYDAVYAANSASVMGNISESVSRSGSNSKTGPGSRGSGSDSPALHHIFSSESAGSFTLESDPITRLRSGLFTLPYDLRDQNVFLVFQVSKVLSGDPDRAVGAYLKASGFGGSMTSSTQSEVAKHRDLCQRLGLFRQSVGVGAMRLFDRQGRVGQGQSGGADFSVPVHVQKVQMNEAQLSQYLRDLFPEDGTSKCRLEVLTELDLRFSLHDLGRESQFPERVPTESISPDAKDSNLFSQVVPAQFFNGHEAARVSDQFRRFTEVERHCIKQVLPLVPSANAESDDVTRRVRRAVDNSLYVYPQALERFNHRNLCLCVQLVEFDDPTVGSSPLLQPDISCAHRVLSNVYSGMAGDVFVAGAYTRVAYHSRTPALNEEFKLRLPNVLTPRHWLLFTVLHVHVRPKKERSSFMGAMRRVSMGGAGASATDKDGDPSCVTIGHGFLQLLQKHPYLGDHVSRHDALLASNVEHVVTITPVNDNAMDALGEEEGDRRASLAQKDRDKSALPSLRVSTCALSSLYSKCPRVQAVLKQDIAPVGKLPTTAPGVQRLWDQYGQGRNSDTEPTPEAPEPEGQLELGSEPEAESRMEVGVDGSAVQVDAVVAPEQVELSEFAAAAASRPRVSLSRPVDVESSTYLGLIHEANLKASLLQLLDAHSGEVATFFYPLMRQLLRVMASGGNDPTYADPTACPPARCWAFLATIHMFGKIAPAVIFSGRGQGSGECYGDTVPTEEDLLAAYVEYLFDEEGDLGLETAKEVEAGGAAGVATECGVDGVGNEDTHGIQGKLWQLGDCFGSTEEYTEELAGHLVNECSRVLLDALVGEAVDSTCQDLFLGVGRAEGAAAGSGGAPSRPSHRGVVGGIRNLFGIPSNSPNMEVDSDRSRTNVPLATAESISRELGVGVKEVLGLMRDWSASGASNLDLLVHRGVRSSTTAGGAFDAEREYFRHLESGLPVVAPPGDPHPDDVMLGGADLGAAEFDCDCFSDFPERAPSGDITARGALPPYCRLKGYPERSALGKGEVEERGQWWPWLYEVLVAQWLQVLVCLHGPEVLSSDSHTAYPISLADLPKSNKDHRDTRILLMDHSALLFSMIIKSLALRVHREQRRVPVVLDTAVVSTLEKLVCALAVEISSRFASQWHYERLNAAFAKFLCELSALVVPSIMNKLISVYCVQIQLLVSQHANTSNMDPAKRKRLDEGVGGVGAAAEALELQLRVFDQLSLLEYFVPLNFPVAVDFPLQALLRSDFTLAVGSLCAPSLGLRGDPDPSPCWLVHMLIREALSVYRRSDVGVIQRQLALGILRDLVVRQAYDVRYQRPEDAEQIALMYFPLLLELLRECEHLFGLQHDSWERKEVLILLMHLLRNIPAHVMREQLRLFARAAVDSVVEETHLAASDRRSRTFSASSVPGNDRGNGRAGAPFLSFVRLTSAGSPAVDHLVARVTATSDIFRCVYLLHLVLDTFEFPISKGGESGVPTRVLAPGLDAALDGSNIVDTMSGAADQKTRLENILMQRGGGGQKRAFRPVGAAVGGGGTGAAGGNPKHGSEVRRWKRNVRGGPSNGGGRHAGTATATDGTPGIPPTVPTPTERKYNTLGGTERIHVHAGTGVADPAVRNRKLLSVPKVDPMELLNAAKCISNECSSILLDTLKVLLEEGVVLMEAPREMNLRGSVDGGVAAPVTHAAVAAAVATEYLAQVIAVVLHGLHMQQCELMAVGYLNMLRLVLRRNSGRSVFAAMGDTLQDWVRTLLLCCASQSTKIRIPACNVLLLLMRSYFYSFGSVSPLARISLCVLGDVMHFVLVQHVKSAGVRAAEFLHSLEVSLGQMVAACESFCSRVVRTDTSARFAQTCACFLKSMQKLFRAHECLRQQKQIVIVDYENSSNMLDGPYNTKASARLTAVKATNLAASSVAVSTSDKLRLASPFADPYAMMELFYEAADLFSPVHNPRQHIFWLENLTKFQEIQGNLAESAELRWKIYQTCCRVACSYTDLKNSAFDGSELWSPRAMLKWQKGGRAAEIMLQSGTASDRSAEVVVSLRNFLLGLYSTLHVKAPARCWQDRDQLYQHMEVSLKVAAERYLAASLFSLAERAWLHMVALYRYDRSIKKIAWAYERISQSYGKITEATSAFAMGSFFRVLYLGRGLPAELRDREFIYRNGKQLHVSEFQALIKEHLLGLVPPGTVVSVVPDTQNVPEAVNTTEESGPPAAVIVMTSVKPLMTNASPFVSLASCLDEAAPTHLGGAQTKHAMFSGQLIENALVDNSVTDDIVCDAASATQVYKFQYSVPFTKDAVEEGGKRRAHAKNMDEQWKRTITLRVPESFPAIVARQLVAGREVRELSPIENGTEDIMERIESMQALLEKSEDGGNASIDKNDIMRLIQGTVMPQVNAGVAEVAKVFLHRAPDDPASVAAKQGASVTLRQQAKLQLTLIEFMVNAKKCLELTRKLLLSPVSSADSGDDNAAAQAGGASESSYQIWQSEMEKAYDGLVAALSPVFTMLLPESVDGECSGPLTAVTAEAQQLCAYCRQFVKDINLQRV